ncbi:uncharacterized protein LOC107006401 [Solanum pennellii]|uniref:Uncharacterized protein LOC107006401 n=1 Tax=Solanum pennellii TaxID=28526 RepID=A0ABM1FQZ4_SOLPN|nr:uncharacterized protein LOC107006401 [Solanum pennellii]
MGSDPSYISSFTKSLDLQFSLKDLGDLSFFLGTEVPRVGFVCISLKLATFGTYSLEKMTDCKPSSSPADSTFQLSKHGETFDDPSLYRSIVGALQYAIITRPEISFSKDVKQILRYLKGSLTHGITITPSTSSIINVYCDAGRVADPDNRRSHHVFSVYYGPNLISCSSRKKKVVARSSTEAEYRAITFVASKVSWITSLVKELRLSCPRPPMIFCDNISVIYLTDILSFIKGLIILKLIIILFERRLLADNFVFNTFLPLIKLLMCLPKLSSPLDLLIYGPSSLSRTPTCAFRGG